MGIEDGGGKNGHESHRWNFNEIIKHKNDIQIRLFDIWRKTQEGREVTDEAVRKQMHSTEAINKVRGERGRRDLKPELSYEETKEMIERHILYEEWTQQFMDVVRPMLDIDKPEEWMSKETDQAAEDIANVLYKKEKSSEEPIPEAPTPRSLRSFVHGVIELIKRIREK